jgi:hypothetical protein
MVAIVLLLASLRPATADILTLITGEQLEGEIVAETPAEYQLRLANDDFTIVHVRPVPATNVTAVVRDTPQQKTARQTYETLCRYRLHPDRELPAKHCEAAITVMQQFLTDYPDAPTADSVRQKLAFWKTELTNVTNGLAKHHNRWMTPADKQTAIRLAHRQAQLRTAQSSITQFRRQLTALDTQFVSLTNALVTAERDLVLSTFELSRLQDFVQPEYSFRPVGGAPRAIIYGNHYQVWSPAYWEKYVSGEKVTVHPARAGYQRRVGDLQLRVSSYRTEIQTIEDRRTAVRARLAQAEATVAALRQ